ncbi:MAG: flagellar motor protein MotB [Pseudomonadota bacterium]
MTPALTSRLAVGAGVAALPHRAPRASSSWLLTFADLLGIVLAMFVLVYATSDRHAQTLEKTAMSLRAALPNDSGSARRSLVTQTVSGVGYQTALLEKFITDLPAWTLRKEDDRVLKLELLNKPLAEAIGDGLWLDVVERFEVPVRLIVYAAPGADAAALLNDAQALLDARAKRGLQQPWSVIVEPDAQNQALRAAIVLVTRSQRPGIEFIEISPNTMSDGPVNPEADTEAAKP